jgi:hypothetical protein
MSVLGGLDRGGKRGRNEATNMATKKSVGKKKAATTQKTAAKPQAAVTAKKKTISVHPKLAEAIQSLRKLAPSEVEEVRAIAAKAAASGIEATACFLSDTGGQQHCINLPSDVCTRRGGISLPTPCPNN